MGNIGTEKRAVFLVVPDEKTTYHFLAVLFISQCYESLLENAEQNNYYNNIKYAGYERNL